MSVSLSRETQQCDTCGHVRPCLVVVIADDVADMSRSALTLRTMAAAVCRPCMDATMVQRVPGVRHRWDERPES